MGFWGGVAAIGSAICGAVSSICGGIGGALMTGISAFASSLVGIIAATPGINVIAMVILVCQTICKVAELLAEKPEEEKPEELAVMAEEAELKPENFDSVSAYIAYLREQIKVNKEQIDQKIEAMDKKDIAYYQAIGSSLYSKQIDEKYNVELTPEFWKTVTDKKMSEKVVSEYVANMSANGIKNGDSLANFVEGRDMDINERSSVFNTMKEAIRKENPGLSEKELNVKVSELKSRTE